MSLLGFRPYAAVARRRTHAWTRRSVLALGAYVVAGCASYAPRPLVPAQDLERLLALQIDELRIDYGAADALPSAGPLRFDPSDGLDESELAAVALTINPGLRARRAGIGEAQALLVTAGLLPNPDLGLFIRPGLGGSTATAFGLEALFGLLRPDERPARRAVAEAGIELVRAEIEAEELRLVAQVRQARIAVLSAEQAARLLQQELTLRDEAVALVRQQRELGETTEIPLALVELDRTTVQRNLREAQAVSERERRSLGALLGVQPTLELGLVGSGADLAFAIAPDMTDDQLDARLLAGRAELRARAADYRLAEQELRLAVARQYPRVGVGPSYDKDIEGGEGLGLGASIEVPLFDRNQGEIAGKSAARERKRAEYVATLHDLRARAFDARALMRRARAEVELQQSDVLPLVQRTEALFQGALRARELSIFEWLIVRARAVQARRDLLDALTRYASAVVELDSATGSPLVTVLTDASNAGSER